MLIVTTRLQLAILESLWAAGELTKELHAMSMGIQTAMRHKRPGGPGALAETRLVRSSSACNWPRRL